MKQILMEETNVVSYQSESFSSKWELPFLPPSSLKLWRKERAKQAALILMKNSHFDRTLRYRFSCLEIFRFCDNVRLKLQSHCVLFIESWKEPRGHLTVISGILKYSRGRKLGSCGADQARELNKWWVLVERARAPSGSVRTNALNSPQRLSKLYH